MSRVKAPKPVVPFFALPLKEQVHRAHGHAYHIVAAAVTDDAIAADLEAVVGEIAGTDPSSKDAHAVLNLVYAARALGLVEGVFLAPGDVRQWRPASRVKRPANSSRAR